MSLALKAIQFPEAEDRLRTETMSERILESWAKIAPFWPLENLIAVNPLRGLEHLPFEEALRQAEALFEQQELPEPMSAVNRESIKWLQAFCDEGQATIRMPLRENGLYRCWKTLAVFDARLTGRDPEKRRFIEALPDDPERAIALCLARMAIPEGDYTRFLTLTLSTLPGWAAYVQYRTSWTGYQSPHTFPLTQTDFLAVRVAICSLLWNEARGLLDWHENALKRSHVSSSKLNQMEASEARYRSALLAELQTQHVAERHVPAAQLVFCIDVRSEPFRRALEATGDYQTFGFAGFFGLPVAIRNAVTGETHASCPVLLNPAHTVIESPCGTETDGDRNRKGYRRLSVFKRLYQSVKYTFTTPFMLVETLGPASGLWMALRSFAPRLADALRARMISALRPAVPVAPSLESIGFKQRCAYAEGALRAMGLTSHFAPLVVLCGHGSTTRNNAYASALDCGACGGRHGAPNARILAAILNDPDVRQALAQNGLRIPTETLFVAAEHDTTSDKVELFTTVESTALTGLKADLEHARRANSAWRCTQMAVTVQNSQAADATLLRTRDWAQVRPEWGLARNAAFIVAPRSLSRLVDLSGRCFLHSYEYAQDQNGSALETILTAPMVVAQWINAQYLFSTLNNVAYGGGSKITKNVTGKIGIMQGNASDLMTGLPLQSVFASDTTPYHEPQRLMTIVYAPRARIDPIIARHDILQTLCGNGWVCMACIEPETREAYYLQRDLTWKRAN